MAGINLDRLKEHIAKEHKPFISYVVNTTGIMDGNDNRITQIALSAYKYDTKDGQYHNQDSIFMLAKADKDVLENIEKNMAPTLENCKRKVLGNVLYDMSNKVKGRTQTRQKNLNKIDSKTSPSPVDLKKREKIIEELEELEDARIHTDALKIFMDVDFSTAWKQASEVLCSEEELLRKVEYMRKELEGYSLDNLLKQQGIYSKEEWLNTDIGLTNAEMQVGIDKFLEQYLTEGTVILSNDAYISNHYLRKENMALPEGHITVDVPKTDMAKYDMYREKYMHDRGDALQKSKNMAKIAGEIAEFQVSEKPRDKEIEAIISDEHNNVFTIAGYYNDHYDIYDTVNDNVMVEEDHYLHIGEDDEIFAVNENYEVIFVGTEAPIKDWEELKEKIKSMNPEIKEEQLEILKAKYEKAMEQAAKENPLYQCPDVITVTKTVEKTTTYTFTQGEFEKWKEINPNGEYPDYIEANFEDVKTNEQEKFIREEVQVSYVPKQNELFLLSAEEYRRYQDIIKPTVNNWFWLRDTNEVDIFMDVDAEGCVNECGIFCGEDIAKYGAIRPAVLIDPNLITEDRMNSRGLLNFAGENWLVLNKEKGFLFAAYEFERGCLEPKSTDYVNSKTKAHLEDMSKKMFSKELSVTEPSSVSFGKMTSSEIFTGMDASQKDDVYRMVWADHVYEDAMAYLENNEKLTTDQMDEVASAVANRYVYNGDYDCNQSYNSNIENLVDDEELKVYEEYGIEL